MMFGVQDTTFSRLLILTNIQKKILLYITTRIEHPKDRRKLHISHFQQNHQNQAFYL